MLQLIADNFWQIIITFGGIVIALIKFNYDLFNRVIKSESETNANKIKSDILEAKEELRKEFSEQIERRIGHSERNLLNQIPYWVKEANKNEK